MLTQARLKELIKYEPDTGNFIWIAPTRRRIVFGSIAGCLMNGGYWHIRIDAKKYLAHRLAWLYVHGEFPIEHLDHIDGNRINNRFSNIRACSRAENGQNRISNKNSTSKYLGVHWHRLSNRWQAQIRINKKPIYLGLFDSEQDAYAAYCKAKKEIHTFNPEIRKAD